MCTKTMYPANNGRICNIDLYNTKSTVTSISETNKGISLAIIMTCNTVLKNNKTFILDRHIAIFFLYICKVKKMSYAWNKINVNASEKLCSNMPLWSAVNQPQQKKKNNVTTHVKY